MYFERKHVFFELIAKNHDETSIEDKSKKETRLLNRHYGNDSFHIDHNSGNICLQSHSKLTHGICPLESMSCFHFPILFFDPVADCHFVLECFTVLEVQPFLVFRIRLGYIVSARF